MKRSLFPVVLWLIILMAVTGSMLIGRSDRREDERAANARRERPPRDRIEYRADPWRARSAEARRQFTERMRERLDVNDEQWQVLLAHIERVVQLQMGMRGWLWRGFGRRSSRAYGGWPMERRHPEPSAVEQQSVMLRNLLDDPSTPQEQIAEAVTSLRNERETARLELSNAQKDLRDLVTHKQEAHLIVMGILD